ncbi:hypothetical protein ZWY2020_007209 [Hordeum vulgare]|nr:hypothetical protein ZWY2020_007209 [Hordeum vulgare]
MPRRGFIPLTEESIHQLLGIPHGDIDVKYEADYDNEDEILRYLDALDCDGLELELPDTPYIVNAWSKTHDKLKATTVISKFATGVGTLFTEFTSGVDTLLTQLVHGLTTPATSNSSKSRINRGTEIEESDDTSSGDSSESDNDTNEHNVDIERDKKKRMTREEHIITGIVESLLMEKERDVGEVETGSQMFEYPLSDKLSAFLATGDQVEMDADLAVELDDYESHLKDFFKESMQQKQQLQQREVMTWQSRGGPRQQAATDSSRAPDLLTAPPPAPPAGCRPRSTPYPAAGELLKPSPPALPPPELRPDPECRPREQLRRPTSCASPRSVPLLALPLRAAAARAGSSPCRAPRLPVPPDAATTCLPSASAPSRPGSDPDRPVAALALTAPPWDGNSHVC